MTKQKRLLAMIGFLVFFVLLITIAATLGGRAGTPSETPSSVDAGVTYLKELEAKSPVAIEEMLKEFRRQEIQQMRDEYLSKLESGEISVWSLFQDYVLMGDSRVMGFDFYEYLDDSRVMANKGDTIYSLQEQIPDIVAMNPSYLFISYGVNDVGSRMWSSPEAYTADLTKIIEDIRSQLPDIRIFVNSILLAYDPAFSTSSAWYNIPEYNAALEQMCADLNCGFVDNTALCETYASLYEGDGIHVAPGFYPHWATNMIMEVYDSELDENENPAA